MKVLDNDPFRVLRRARSLPRFAWSTAIIAVTVLSTHRFAGELAAVLLILPLALGDALLFLLTPTFDDWFQDV